MFDPFPVLTLRPAALGKSPFERHRSEATRDFTCSGPIGALASMSEMSARLWA